MCVIEIISRENTVSNSYRKTPNGMRHPVPRGAQLEHLCNLRRYVDAALIPPDLYAAPSNTGVR